MMSPTPESQNSSRPRLSADEARIVDAMLASMAQSRRQRETGSKLRLADEAAPALTPADAPKVAKVESLFKVLGCCAVEGPPADLTQKTLERVADDKRRRWFAEQAQALAAPRVGMTWREVAAVAAILLIGFSLLFPMVGRMRESARQAACAGNLQTAGMAVSHYAADNNDALPRRAAYTGAPWWNVGQQTSEGQPVQSNSAHTYLLVRRGYANPDALNCPDNAYAAHGLSRDLQDWRSASEVSYSTLNQFGPQGIQLSRTPGNDLALMADKNPLFGGQPRPGAPMQFLNLSPMTPSAFHGGKGQNILMLHGGVLWSARPVLPNGDNIWTIKGVDRYTGTETPVNTNDTHLVP